MADPKPTHTYVGNPGYEYAFVEGAVVLNPGDEVTLTAEQAATVGDDFAPLAKAKTTPSGDDTKEP